MKFLQNLLNEMEFPSSSDMAKMMYKDIVRLYASSKSLTHDQLINNLKQIVDKYANAHVNPKAITTRYDD